VDATFDASKEAITKAENANERRFDAVNEFRSQLNDQQAQFVLREVFDQSLADARRRSDALTELIQQLSVRLTEIEARGVGEKDYAAESKSQMAIGIAGAGLFVSIAISLINVFI
jgi:hypothetical protein